MDNSIESSIVIPVYNNWKFTQNCLIALQKTLSGKSCEVIVIDNGSRDETPVSCPTLGSNLFGEFFHYKRFEENLNFGPASNYGASIARGKYVIFLNNDTVPLDGWYEPLMEDFTNYPGIAATGPLLVFPESEPFGHTIQHLGVVVTPFFQFTHLYEGIPADSLLAKKRRFFQVITGACLVMRRDLFMEVGQFDERYINGYEDVDLCCRLISLGYKLTVNPDSMVVHYASQTEGRTDKDDENYFLLIETSIKFLYPDRHIFLKNDGLELKFDQWQVLQDSMPEEMVKKLNGLSKRLTSEELQSLLLRYPLWIDGYFELMDQLYKKGIPIDGLVKSLQVLQNEPATFFNIIRYLDSIKSPSLQRVVLSSLIFFCKDIYTYINDAKSFKEWSIRWGLSSLTEEIQNWLANKETFYEKKYLPFIKNLAILHYNTPLNIIENWAYTLWRNNLSSPAITAEKETLLCTDEGNICFSILMPTYNPKSKHITEAVDSILAQDYPHWELCLADDASDPESIKIIESVVAKDSRIRIVYREKNGNIAAATNTALDMAKYRYAVLMDQDDLLTPDALGLVARAIADHPEAALIFSDEDKVSDNGDSYHPHVKNNKWDRIALYAYNYISHLGVYRADRLRAIGGFRDGFPGSQDYEMVLRYTCDLPDEKIVHIPKVLYHWRAHAGSTALSISSKKEALDSTTFALQSLLSEKYPGAVASKFGERTNISKVVYPLPGVLPLVSLIIDIEDNFDTLKQQILSLLSKTSYSKFEIIILYNEKLPKDVFSKFSSWIKGEPQVTIVPYSSQLTLAQRHNFALQMVHGSVIGFLAKGAIPLDKDWLEQIIGQLYCDNVGAVSGRLVNKDEYRTVLHTGYMADATGKLSCLFRNVGPRSFNHVAWGYVTRTVDALDSHCLFTYRHLLQSTDGFDVSFPLLSAQDYCLRIADDKFKSVWIASVLFLLTSPTDLPWVNGSYIEDSDFYARWGKKLQPFSPNLVHYKYGWAFNKALMNVSSDS